MKWNDIFHMDDFVKGLQQEAMRSAFRLFADAFDSACSIAKNVVHQAIFQGKEPYRPNGNGTHFNYNQQYMSQSSGIPMKQFPQQQSSESVYQHSDISFSTIGPCEWAIYKLKEFAEKHQIIRVADYVDICNEAKRESNDESAPTQSSPVDNNYGWTQAEIINAKRSIQNSPFGGLLYSVLLPKARSLSQLQQEVNSK